ncbi:hypothetical protein ACLOJK_009122 [Asimina triloba]
MLGDFRIACACRLMEAHAGNSCQEAACIFYQRLVYPESFEKMKLAPREVEKLGLHGAGFLAQKRLARGLRLNYTEAVALIATQFEVVAIRRQVLPAVPYLLDAIQCKALRNFISLVEGTFSNGTKLVTIHDAISCEDGNLELALYGSFLPVPSLDKFLGSEYDVFPGEIIFGDGNIVINKGRRAVCIEVTNKADRPIQVGSHYHFIEVNPYMVFDRSKANGMRLNIPAGTATRFEVMSWHNFVPFCQPGETKPVVLVSIGGRKVIRGGNGIADGPFHLSRTEEVIRAVNTNGFGNEAQLDLREGVVGEDVTLTKEISHEAYANLYGPTTGDKIRLGDTNLYAEIEKDFAVYGDECVFGGGKVLRDGMGQAAGYPASECLDTVITNSVIIDYTGIYKADIGIKGDIIVCTGKAGNPDVMDCVDPNMIIGVNTEVIAGEGMIVTAGAIDCHIHFICPQIAEEAIASGVTTLIGGGTGPAHGTCATTCTPAPMHMQLMLQSTDDLPINMGFTGKGNTSKPDGLREIICAGAMGLKLHEDWGTTPAAIDNCLTVADAYDIQVNIHTDTLNESGCVEHTVAAFKERTIHTYHSEGAGGGHAPDIIKVCGVKNVLPSSTNPTRPYTTNTIDEHFDMLMVAHHLDKNIPEDVAFAESRIRAETIAAEDILHDMGAISIISSDSQAMGRAAEELCYGIHIAGLEIGNRLCSVSFEMNTASIDVYMVISRTWQTAHKMNEQRGDSIDPSGPDNDNFRIKRYIAKYTINPAIANGICQYVGSIESGKLADLVMWKPSFFGVKPEMVIKGGAIAWANMGDPNASIPTPEPAAKEAGIGKEYGLKKRLEAVGNVRNLTKLDMKLNDALPKIEVDPETYKVSADGEVLACSAVTTVPLSTNYFLF